MEYPTVSIEYFLPFFHKTGSGGLDDFPCCPIAMKKIEGPPDDLPETLPAGSFPKDEKRPVG
jgi:hypothetical protein